MERILVNTGAAYSLNKKRERSHPSQSLFFAFFAKLPHRKAVSVRYIENLGERMSVIGLWRTVFGQKRHLRHL